MVGLEFRCFSNSLFQLNLIGKNGKLRTSEPDFFHERVRLFGGTSGNSILRELI